MHGNTVYLIDKDEVESAITYALGEIEEAKEEINKVCQNALPTYEPCNRLRRMFGEFEWNEGTVQWSVEAIKDKLTEHKHTFGPLPW